MPNINGGWAPPREGVEVTPTFAILQDLSGVVETPDGFGIFATRLAALEALILRLESDRTDVTDKIRDAKRARRREQRRVKSRDV